MPDYSKPDVVAMFNREVEKRMGPPAFMSRDQATMLVAVLLSEQEASNGDQGGAHQQEKSK